jgi:pilus assembly protein Flp/PilA
VLRSLSSLRGLSKRLAHLDDCGVTAVEYCLMAMLIALVIIGGVILLGQNLSSIFDHAASGI